MVLRVPGNAQHRGALQPISILQRTPDAVCMRPYLSMRLPYSSAAPQGARLLGRNPAQALLLHRLHPCCVAPRHGTARYSMAQSSLARHGTAWHGAAQHGTARHEAVPGQSSSAAQDAGGSSSSLTARFLSAPLHPGEKGSASHTRPLRVSSQGLCTKTKPSTADFNRTKK